MLAFVAIAQTATTEPKQAVIVSDTPTSPPRCNAAPYRHLIGRTLGEVMNTQFPPNTRIYRIGDPPVIGEAGRNRLNIEINNRTRVRRVYCS